MIVSCIPSPRSQSAPIAARSSSSSSPSFPLRNLITSASRVRRPWQTKPCMLHRKRGMDSSRHAPGGGSCARDSSFLIRSCRTRHFVPSNISYVCPGPVVANDPSFISYEKLAQTKLCSRTSFARSRSSHHSGRAESSSSPGATFSSPCSHESCGRITTAPVVLGTLDTADRNDLEIKYMQCSRN
jgi:hypothetical protein